MYNLREKLIDLYNLGEKEGIKFFNTKMSQSGSTHRSFGVTLIVINIKLGEKEEYIVLAHEIGHYYMDCTTAFSVPVQKQLDEARAHKWKAKYLIPREKFEKAMRSTFVFNDYELAEELGVDIDSVARIREVFRAQGLPVSQAELGCVYREP